jgi:hypothetical protein
LLTGAKDRTAAVADDEAKSKATRIPANTAATAPRRAVVSGAEHPRTCCFVRDFDMRLHADGVS